MMKFVWLVLLASIACRLIAGRWPWQFLGGLGGVGSQRDRARRLLGLSPDASRQDIIEAHRRLIAAVHPDRGGTSERVHEANEARDLLLAELDNRKDSK
jgi:DnaJ homolog subfamily C member 19